MFYLRYDDIEGLFREAAENYQINADKAFDWENINRSVHEEPGKENTPGPKKKNKLRFIIWFILLVSIGLLSYHIWTFQSAKNLHQQNTSVSAKGTPGNKSRDADKGLSQGRSNHLQEEQDHAVQPFSNKDQMGRSLANNHDGRGDINMAVKNQDKNELTSKDENTVLNKETNADLNPIALKNPITSNDPPRNVDKNISQLIDPKKNVAITGFSKQQKPKKKSGSKFYAGAFVAPDVTFIKFQQSNGVGGTFGLTVGFQYNKNWSIESGISLDTKKYYTDGEYFDKSNVPVLYDAQLLSVSGSCNMLEMPINIRYKFPSGSNHNWTAAIGASSYFMTKESYDYSMIAWGQNVEGNYTNHSSSTHLFAVINLSAGYERKLNNVSLLIEPYYKAPVKGIGTGNLHMSSAGINIGIKKYFGR